MCKKLRFLMSVVLVLGLVNSASARMNVTWSYDEVGADNWWNIPNNWLDTRLEYGNLPGFDDRVLISTEGLKAPVIDARCNGIDSNEAYFNQLRIGQDGNGMLTITGGRLMGCGSVRLGPGVGAGTIIMTGGILDTIAYWNDTGGSGRLDIGDRGGSEDQPVTNHLMDMSGDSECHLTGVLQVGQWQSRRAYTQYGHLQLGDNALMDCDSLSIRCDDGELGTAIDANTLSARGTIDITGNGTLQIREDALNEYDFGTNDEMAWYGGLSLSDYINLGYITGYGRVRALIVTYDAKTNITTIVADPKGGPGRAYKPFPRSGEIDVPLYVVVPHWVPGDNAVQHDVYFAGSFEDVNGADISDTTGIYRGRQDPNSYTFPEALEWGATWYWRIDEIEADNTIHKGAVWDFTAIDHLVVDNFEAYNDLDPTDPNSNRIFNTWIDGYGVATNGSTVGYADPPFAEQSIVHSGSQAMPFLYDNSGPAKYSEATMTLSYPRDWTEQGVGVLSLLFRGQPPYFGSFTEAPTGTYTMTARGTDIWDESDQFHFAYKQLSGTGTIIAKVESVENTDEWAKAGVMIRDTLEADSRHAMVAVTPTSGIWFGRRETAGDSSSSVKEPGIPFPQWVKIERTATGLVRAYYSADGATWTQLGTPKTVIMDMPVYIGLALTSHDVDVTCKAVFSNVTSDGTGDWADQDIGISSNGPEPIYVAIADQTSPAVVVYNDDPNAAQIDTWTQWTIDLQKFAGVDLTNVDRLSIGFGGADDPQPGTGLVFFDDIRLYRPTSDLLVHWAFDEGSETTAGDSSGSNRIGNVSGATWTSGGYDGTGFCLNFGGAGDFVVDENAADYLNDLDGLTVATWVKSDVTDTDNGFIYFRDPDNADNCGMRYDKAGHAWSGTNVIKCGITPTSGTQEYESASNVQTIEWQHLAMVWSSGEPLKLYINGVLDTPTGTHQGTVGTTTGNTKLIIGRGGKDNKSDESWDGLIDDVRIYNRALTQPEIETVRDGGTL